jgi:hypothetical protein
MFESKMFKFDVVACLTFCFILIAKIEIDEDEVDQPRTKKLRTKQK